MVENIFLARIQEQFPQIWDLCSKIETNIKFYLTVYFQQKSMTSFFKIKEKPYFGVIFEHIFSFLLSTTAVASQHLNVKDKSRLAVKPKIIPSLSAWKNHSINLLNSSNHLCDTPDLRVPQNIYNNHPIITKVTFSFPKHAKNSSFHQFILEMQQSSKT